MKRCSRCGHEKEPEEFGFRSKGSTRLRSWCRKCKAAYDKKKYHEAGSKTRAAIEKRTREHRVKIRQIITSHLKSHPCVDCGEDDYVVLDFDHVRGEKDFEIGKARAKTVGIERLLKEIAKCDVRCANCHRRKTARRRQQVSGLGE